MSTKIVNLFKRNYLFFIILLLAFALRILMLEKVPFVITASEIEFALSPLGSFFARSEFFIRLPAVIFATATVGLFYFLVKSFFKGIGIQKNVYSFVAMVMLAISPWHIQVSRVDFVSSLVLSVFVLALYVGFKLTPNKRSVAITAIILLAVGYGLFVAGNKDSTQEYLMSSIEKVSKERIFYSGNTPLSKVLYESAFEKTKLIHHHIFQYIEPTSLFFGWGHNPSFITKSVGLFYPHEIVLLLLGVAYLFTKYKKRFVFVLAVVFFMLLILANTGSSPDVRKIILFLPTLMATCAVGVYSLVENFKSKKTVLVVLSVAVFGVSRFFYDYYFIYPKLVSVEGEYKKAFLLLNDIKTNKQIIVVDVSYGKNMNRYALFYVKNKKVTTIYEEPKEYLSNKVYAHPIKEKDSDKFMIGIFETK